MAFPIDSKGSEYVPPVPSDTTSTKELPSPSCPTTSLAQTAAILGIEACRKSWRPNSLRITSVFD
jgi:hypothetical protein